MAKKPIVCAFCKNEIQAKPCPYCGTGHVTLTGATIITDARRQMAALCHGVITDRYMILRTPSQKEMARETFAGSFGLIGSLIHDVAESARSYPYGFYDLRELQKAVYPFYNNKLKKPVAIRFVNRDGTDFILTLQKKSAALCASELAALGVPVENGEGANAGEVFCSRPFINAADIGLRICASAAQFVRPAEKQFVAPPITGAQPGFPQQQYPQQQYPQQQYPNQQYPQGPKNGT